MNLINQKIIYGAILKNVSLLEKLSKELNLDIKDLKKYLENSVDLTPTKNCVNESIIYIDGGSRGNPGESGIGIVIETDNKKKGYYFYTGIMTNNQAEYRGLLKALEISKTLNLKKIKIFSDSELLCNQINGRYKVNNEQLKILHCKASEMISDFDSFSIKHIRREKNCEADKLANMAMDKKNNDEVELTVATYK